MELNNIGKEYSVPAETIKFDDAWIHYNRRYDDKEYNALKESIISAKQTRPIAINSETGLCEDGYTRVQICKELNIDVKCIIIDGKASTQTRRDSYRVSDVGRDYNTAQKAVMAYRYMQLTGDKIDKAALKHKVDVRSVHPVITIAGLGRHDVLNEILETGKWNGIRDIRKISSELRTTAEDVIKVSEPEIDIDYIGMINTAKGQNDFWALSKLIESSKYERNLLAVRFLNLQYKLKENSGDSE